MSDMNDLSLKALLKRAREDALLESAAEITDLEAQLAAKDALIRDLVGALQSTENYIANTEREFDIELSSGTKARAALTRAKEIGYE